MPGPVPRVTGLRETLAELKEFDPKLRRATNRRLRKAVAPMQSAVRTRLPSVPMSGWVRSGRYRYDRADAAKKVKVRIGGRGRRSSSTWPLVTLSQTSAAGIVFDMAGRRSTGKTPQGRAFISTLTSRFGGASRSMWPGAESEMDTVQHEVLVAAEEAAAATNRKLRVRGV